MMFAIKAEVREPPAMTLAFRAARTMYGGTRFGEWNDGKPETELNFKLY